MIIELIGSTAAFVSCQRHDDLVSKAVSVRSYTKNWRQFHPKRARPLLRRRDHAATRAGWDRALRRFESQIQAQEAFGAGRVSRRTRRQEICPALQIRGGAQSVGPARLVVFYAHSAETMGPHGIQENDHASVVRGGSLAARRA